MARHLFLLVILFFVTLFPTGIRAQDEPKSEPFNGLITDIAGNPIKGAKIYVINDKYFARSNKKGQFGLTNVYPTDTLHVLYQKQLYDIPVAGRKSIRIHLGDQLQAQEDEELVAFGYGWIKRRENVQPSNGISGEVLVRMGRNSIMESLVGLVPGLMVGPNGKAIIRGISSINLSTEPLYLVDGVVTESFDYVNVYDVDHVEVLKDASIYGSRGANGAILVFTKRGK